MNKGFTLVELIAVITLLGLIAIITTPAYDTISNNTKTRNYESKKNTISKSTINYVEKYFKNLTHDTNDTNNNVLCFTVNYLIENGIITSDSETYEYIKNDITDEIYSGTDVYIKIYYDKDNLKLNSIVRQTADGFESKKDKDGNSINSSCDITF